METKLSCMASDQMPNQAMQPTATARVRTPWIGIISSFFLVVSGFSFGSETAPTPVRTMEVTVFVPADVQKYKEMINGGDFKAAAELRPRWLGRGEFQFGPLPPGY